MNKALSERIYEVAGFAAHEDAPFVTISDIEVLGWAKSAETLESQVRLQRDACSIVKAFLVGLEEGTPPADPLRAIRARVHARLHLALDKALAAEAPAEPSVRERVHFAFDAIAKANTVSILTISEMEAIVNRALSGEFDSDLPPAQTAANG